MRVQEADIDRGWAWIVMLACYAANFIYCLSTYVTGVMYMSLLDRYKQNEGLTSLVGGVYLGLYCLSAPLAVMLMNKYSARIALVIGGILSTAGFALSAFMPNIELVIVTAGILPGLGNGINVTTVTCLMGYYFDRWRYTIISIATLIAGLSIFVGTPFGLYVIETYGLPGFFLVLASMHAQICVCGMLSRPSSIERDVHSQRKTSRKDGTKSAFNTFMDLSLLTRWGFLCFVLSTSAWNFAYYMAVIHLPKYISLHNPSKEYISYVMMSFAVANISGRLMASLLVSKSAKKSLYVYTGLLCIVGVATASLPLYSGLGPGVLIYSIQLGLFIGCFATMMPSLTLIFVSNTHISDANAIVNFFSGFGSIVGPILAGFIYSAFKSYEYSFVLSGAILLIGSAFAMASCFLWKPVNDEWSFTIEVKEPATLSEKQGLYINGELPTVKNETSKPTDGIDAELNEESTDLLA